MAVTQFKVNTAANDRHVDAYGRKRYCCGFLVDKVNRQVVLIEKKRPAWQAGKLNGVGGKVEAGESPYEAMRREFAEEAGAVVDDWRCFAIVVHGDGVIYMFVSVYGDQQEPVIEQMTDEWVQWWEIDYVMTSARMGNLDWLIPLALSGNREVAVVNDPEPIPKVAA